MQERLGSKFGPYFKFWAGSLTRRKSRSPGKNGKNGGKKLSTSDATILALPDSREKLEEAPKDQENAESRKLSHKRKTPSQQDLQIHRNTDKHSPITETSSKTEEESPEPEKALRIKKSRPSGEKSWSAGETWGVSVRDWRLQISWN